MKVLVFVVAYSSENRIASVLARVPAEFWTNDQHDIETLIIDDRSPNQSVDPSRFPALQQKYNAIILPTSTSQGYGGNQKLGFHYAIENDFDIVVLLHGDGQYAPERLPDFVAAFADPAVDAVFGSRMLPPGAALVGGMPLYKYISNRFLTAAQNLLLRQKLSEYHTGYRAFSRQVLESLPLDENTDDFVFDNEMLAQIIFFGFRIGEISCPTKYFAEASSISFGRSVKYGLGVLWTSIKYRLQKMGFGTFPIFDEQGRRLLAEYYEEVKA